MPASIPRALVACATLVACSSPPRRPATSGDPASAFDDLAAAITEHLHDDEPAGAVELGLHDHDGKLPDRSPDGLARSAAELARDRDALVAAAPTTARQRLERDVLLAEIRARLFRHTTLDVFHTNPMVYADAINLGAYILRDYAPLARRAGAVVELCAALPGYLAQARASLRTPMPRPWIDTALLQTRGLAEFADRDVRRAVAEVAGTGPALDTCKRALTEHAAWLEAQQPDGTDDFALGEARFLQMLVETEGVTIDLARLRELADADLARNLRAIEDAARAIDPTRPTAAVVRALADDKPEDVLATATAQVAALRRFVVDHHVVSIPSDEVAEVRATPPFLRWNSAFLDAPGPFEARAMPSFYYISPPDPAWPAAERRAYLPARADLLFTTAHEVWPGHFLQRLHRKRHPSPIVRAFCTYASSEGWAHYAEEMMFDAGAGGGTPEIRVGMLKEALLRNARFVVTLGLHTGGMTVDQATRLFEDQAFVDPGNARQQAVRGTFDPMYLAYTLGKLMIRKLAADWQAQHPGATLAEFHDAYLSYGCAPVPVIRAAMLGDDAGPPL